MVSAGREMGVLMKTKESHRKEILGAEETFRQSGTQDVTGSRNSVFRHRLYFCLWNEEMELIEVEK